MEFKFYKPGQGTWARWSAGILLALLVLFGCHSLYNFPDHTRDDGTKTAWGKVLVAIGSTGAMDINVALVVSFLVFVAGCIVVYLTVVNGKRLADFLIDTEAEMHKVSWPPRHEYVGSSIVVMISVVIVGLYVTVVDVIFRVILDKTGLLG